MQLSSIESPSCVRVFMLDCATAMKRQEKSEMRDMPSFTSFDKLNIESKGKKY